MEGKTDITILIELSVEREDNKIIIHITVILPLRRVLAREAPVVST